MDNNIDIIPETNTVIDRKDIPDVYYNCFTLCSEKHLEKCNCQEGRIKKASDIIYKKIIAKYDKFQLEDVRLLATQKELSKSMARRIIGKENVDRNIRCVNEQKYYLQFVEEYKGIYDVKDARVHLVLSSLFRLFIKLNKYYNKSNETEILMTSIGKFGESTQINPLEPLILQFEKERISCLEKLDRMINGQKNVNLNIDFKDEMEAAYKRRVEDSGK